MKTLLICLSDKYFNTELTSEKAPLYILNQNSIYPDEVAIISNLEKQSLENLLKQDYDSVFIWGQSTKFSLSEVLQNNNITVDANGVSSGEKFIAVLPNDLNSFGVENVLTAMQRHFGVYHDKVVFKLFGLTLESIQTVTDGISQKYPSCFFHTKTQGLDSKTVLVFDSRAPKVEVDKGIKEFLLTFKNNIYAEDDVTCAERLVELLKLRRLSISTAESMTGGTIASKIVSVQGASSVFFEGLVTYNTSAKETRLGVQRSTVSTHTVVSGEVAFEMAKGLLETKNVETAISITGYADNPDCAKDIQGGLCYIGIGYKGGVEVYKQNFSGDRRQIIETAANCALFLMIKTISNG